MDHRLSVLCCTGALEEVKECLARLENSRSGVTIDAILSSHTSDRGCTPIHLAAENGNVSVLEYLLSKGGKCDLKSNDGQTALHFAAKGRHEECVKVLVKNMADPLVRDAEGKTARDVSDQPGIQCCLINEEIVQMVKHNDLIDKLIQTAAENGQLESMSLSRALIAAVRNKHTTNVKELWLNINVDEALQVAKTENDDGLVYNELRLLRAVMKSDSNEVKLLYAELKTITWPQTSVRMPIEIAEHCTNIDKSVKDELLLGTISKQSHIDWSGLRLTALNGSIFAKTSNVKKLYLNRNDLKEVPSLQCCQMLTTVYLQDNILTEIPPFLLQLPQLRILDLSKNKLKCLPDLLEWSESLEMFNISQNAITSIRGTPLAKSISTLNLAHNHLDAVPECISTFLSLQSLDLSYNSNITCLPLEMGQLTKLHTLKIAGLTKLVDPPVKIHKTLTEENPLVGLNNSTAECMEYLYNTLYHVKPSYRMKIIVVGKTKTGKSTLVACLQGRRFNSTESQGLAISQWKYRPNVLKKKFKFSIWDFGGQEELHSIQKCFLTPAAICILLFSLKDDPAITLLEIEGWLYNISHRSSGSCVYIVGKHSDEIRNEGSSKTNSFLNTIDEVAQKYSSKLQIKNARVIKFENINEFRDRIYESAEEYMFDGKQMMGQLVPSKYDQFRKNISHKQTKLKCAPVIHISEFKALVKNMSHPDSDDELEKLTTFLVNTGTILHYDDQSHDLHDLYFTDPSWLCSIMTKHFCIKEASSCIKEGILLMKNKEELIAGEKFPMQYINQYLTLLDRFGIALVLDRQRILIPSMLPDNRSDSIDIKQLTDNNNKVYIRCIAFDTSYAFIVQDLFSHFISQIIHTIPKLQSLFKTINQDKINAFKLTDSLIQDAQVSDQSLQHLEDVTQVRMEYWKTGMFYQDPQVTFLVESMAKSKVCEGEGILLLASANSDGKNVFCEMVDISQAFFGEIYHGKFKDIIPCPMCLNDNVHHPHIFTYKECFELIMQNKHSIQCSMGHTSQMADIAPDILLLDISPDFRTEHSAIKVEGSVLGKGAFGTVYHGQHKGKSVAVKKFKHFSTMDRDAFSELRREATLHQKFRHPCLICLVGVCLHPELELVLEHAPLGSLGSFLHRSPPAPLSRIVVYRIAAQVAAGLGALHNKGVIYRDLKSANVLLWSVDPESLCHCKLCDFGTATYQSAIGLESSVHGTKGFIAPEVLKLGHRGRKSIYYHKADIFSFGMLLYEMLYRIYPFHDMDSVRIDSAVVRGMRPQLYDTPSASSFFNLTRLMQECWHDNPPKRPSTDDIIKKVSMCSFQSTMSVTKLDSVIYQACVIEDEKNPQIWVCCVTSEGKTEVIPYSLITMKQAGQLYTSRNIVQCIGQCGDFVWIGSLGKSQPGVIEIINSTCNKPLRTIPVGRNITCIACCGKWICCGTTDGYLLAFHSDIVECTTSNLQPVASKKIASCTVDSLVIALDCIWISFCHSIQILVCETFSSLSFITDVEADKGLVGQMKLSIDKEMIWSCNISRSSCLSAWSVSEKRKLFEVNCVQYSMVICPNMENPDHQMVITAMAPVLDTVWVCTRSGYILVLHEKELLMWFEVSKQNVYFMESIPYPGPCQTEKAMVISTGLDKSKAVTAPTLILYEAFPSNMCRQIKLVQDKSSTYLKNHDSVTEIIEEGKFLDGTQITSQYNTNQMDFGSISRY